MRTTEQNKVPRRRESLTRRLISLTVFVLPLCFLGSKVYAQWSITPFVAVIGNYTDNVSLEPAGEENNDFVTEINPGFTATLANPNLSVAADYRMQNLFYAENSQFNNTYHQLQLDAIGELYREKAFIDASATVTQNLLDPSEPAPTGNVNVAGSREDIQSWSISPYYREYFGESTVSEIRYAHGDVEVTDQSSQLNSLSGYIGNEYRAGRIGWAGTYDRRTVDYDTGEEVFVERIEFLLGRAISPTFRLFGTAGYETTEINVVGAEEPTGPLYSLGFSWAPSTRTNMTITVGENAYGPGGSAYISNQTSRTLFQLSYTNEITTVTEELLIDTAFDRTNEVGEEEDSGSLTPRGAVIPEIATDPYINRRVDTTLGFLTTSTGTSLDAYYVEREFLISREEETYYGGRLAWNWRFGARTTAEVYGDYRWQDLTSGAPGDESFEYGIGTIRNFSSQLRGALYYRYYRYESDIRETLRENIISAAIEKRW